MAEMKGVASVYSWISTDETAKEALVRVVGERPHVVLPPPLQRLPIRVGNVVEIVGPSSSGKTLILIQAAVNCILPKEWKGVKYGGLERGVLFIDLDCRFDVSSLSLALKRRIVGSNASRLKSSDNDFDSELFATCMKRFSYTRCYNSFEVLATFKTLLRNEKEKQGGLEYMLMLDSIGAFHWMDHALAVPTSLTYTSSRKKISLLSVAETIVQEIMKLQRLHRIIVLASRSATVGDKHSTVWKSFVSHRVLLHPIPCSDAEAHDQSNPTFRTEWVLPPLKFSDRFTIADICSLI